MAIFLYFERIFTLEFFLQHSIKIFVKYYAIFIQFDLKIWKQKKKKNRKWNKLKIYLNPKLQFFTYISKWDFLRIFPQCLKKFLNFSTGMHLQYFMRIFCKYSTRKRKIFPQCFVRLVFKNEPKKEIFHLLPSCVWINLNINNFETKCWKKIFLNFNTLKIKEIENLKPSNLKKL